MEFSEEQVKDALELRDHIASQIEKHKEEIEMLERNLILINSVLKQQSFTKASSLRESTEKPKSSDYTIPLKKNTDGSLIANAYVTPEQVSIVVQDGIELSEDSHPFKSFFLER